MRRFALASLRLLHVHPLPAVPAQPAIPPSAGAGAALPRFPWGPMLARWGWRLLQLPEDRFPPQVYQLPDAVFQSGWLGAPGATGAQLLAAEQRLGRPLPPSSRAFLQLTNGWPVGLTQPLVPSEEVELFQVKEPEYARIWLEVWPGEDGEEFDLSAADHRVYGTQQKPSFFHHAYLQTALQISEQEDGYVYLLNPEVVTPEGEGEAWILGSKILGAQRWPSFWELVQEESGTQLPGGSPG
ncbi:MAG TPA: SMI1/KNR4 family protein [Ktedonobacterales bacterium]|nr:SMI1/KNR4 family protein [Ktedonobacterales bacterium]